MIQDGGPDSSGLLKATPDAIVAVDVDGRIASMNAAAEAKFRGLLEAAPDAIVGVDPDGRIALVNAQTERLFGYDREELLGQPMEILVPEAVRAVHPGHRSRYFGDPQQRPMGAGTALSARARTGRSSPPRSACRHWTQRTGCWCRPRSGT
jgi:PAS domain S-box-containing protein